MAAKYMYFCDLCEKECHPNDRPPERELGKDECTYYGMYYVKVKKQVWGGVRLGYTIRRVLVCRVCMHKLIVGIVA